MSIPQIQQPTGGKARGGRVNRKQLIPLLSCRGAKRKGLGVSPIVRKREKMKRICFYKDKQMFLPALCLLLGPPVFQPEGAMTGSVSLFQREALSENIAVKVGRSEVAENVRKCKWKEAGCLWFPGNASGQGGLREKASAPSSGHFKSQTHLLRGFVSTRKTGKHPEGKLREVIRRGGGWTGRRQWQDSGSPLLGHAEVFEISRATLLVLCVLLFLHTAGQLKGVQRRAFC